MSKSSRWSKFVFTLLGTVCGLAVFLALGAVVFLGLRAIYKQTPAKVDQPALESTKGIILRIDPNRILRPVNPFIYGSNLMALTEFEMDVVKFAKDAGISNFRYPGSASEGYHWETGKFDHGDRYDRAPINQIDNLIKFCRLSNTAAVLQVNIETGTPDEAARWVRAMNFEKGMRVDYWELGNETYGDWDRNYMTAEEYVEVIKKYSEAMKAVDPAIKIGPNFGGPNFPDFDEALIRGAADHIDFVSYHWYPNHTGPHNPDGDTPHPRAEDIMANSLNVGYMVERMERLLERYAPHRKGKIEICFLEWDTSWDAVPSDLQFSYKGMMWSLANGIAYADTLGQFARNGISVANQYNFQSVMFGLIRGWDKEAGWGGSRWDGVTIRPKGLALKMFARYFGDILLDTQIEGSPWYEKRQDWRADSYTGKIPYVSAYVSKFEEEDKLAIVLINKHAEKNFKVEMLFEDIQPDSEGRVWVLNGPSLESQNDGSPRTVTLKDFAIRGFGETSTYTAPAHSVSLIQIGYERENS